MLIHISGQSGIREASSAVRAERAFGSFKGGQIGMSRGTKTYIVFPILKIRAVFRQLLFWLVMGL